MAYATRAVWPAQRAAARRTNDNNIQVVTGFILQDGIQQFINLLPYLCLIVKELFPPLRSNTERSLHQPLLNHDQDI